MDARSCVTKSLPGYVHNKMEQRSKILVCFSQGMMALAGVAYASLVVSSFSRAQKKVLEMGFEDGINTSTMISGNAVKMGTNLYILSRYLDFNGLPFNLKNRLI